MARKHGLSHTRIHHIWRCMIYRCENPHDHAYKNYGGRGIRVCVEWRNSFLTFYEWATNNGYQENLTIDRINVNGNYEPGNCRWITKGEQTRNKRDTTHIFFRGRTRTLSEWSRLTKIARTTIYTRLECGWSIERALSTPVKKKVNYGKRA